MPLGEMKLSEVRVFKHRSVAFVQGSDLFRRVKTLGKARLGAK